jgi:hypothetical protein
VFDPTGVDADEIVGRTTPVVSEKNIRCSVVVPHRQKLGESCLGYDVGGDNGVRQGQPDVMVNSAIVPTFSRITVISMT